MPNPNPFLFRPNWQFLLGPDIGIPELQLGLLVAQFLNGLRSHLSSPDGKALLDFFFDILKINLYPCPRILRANLLPLKYFPSDDLKIEPPVALVEVQGYQYLALKEVADLAGIKRDWDLAKRLLDRADNLKREFDKKFWMPDIKYYCLALNGKKEQKKSITSNPGHLLFTGIIGLTKIDFVVKRLFEDDLWTPYGIRTHSTKEPDFDPKSYHLGSVWPHDNWIIAQGLKKLRRKNEYQKIKNAILLAYQKIGYLPEFYGVVDGKITLEMKKTPCHPQAWSSGALFKFLSEQM